MLGNANYHMKHKITKYTCTLLNIIGKFLLIYLKLYLRFCYLYMYGVHNVYTHFSKWLFLSFFLSLGQIFLFALLLLLLLLFLLLICSSGFQHMKIISIKVSWYLNQFNSFIPSV